MKKEQALICVALALVVSLPGFSVSAQTAKSEVDLVRTLKDGVYSAQAGYGVYSDSLTFQKRGSHVIGYRGNMAGIWCFQGTLRGDIVEVADAVSRRDDWANGKKTGTFRMEPLLESDEDKLEPFQVAQPIEPFPRKGGLLPQSPQIVKRNQTWLDGCLKFYGGEGVPPCGDPELRGTDLNDGAEPKYQRSTTICSITAAPQYVALIQVEGNSCSVDNVFAVLASTPNTIAPTNDDTQVVGNCGILTLESITSPNNIRVAIDEGQHRVTNYTLPGHVFFPGQVVREIVEVDGQVNVVTTGTGTVKGAKKALNEVLATPLWVAIDENLKIAFAKKFAMAQVARGPKPSHPYLSATETAGTCLQPARILYISQGISIFYAMTANPPRLHRTADAAR